jgi:phosphoribosylformylglycinamidine synthase
VIGVTTDTGHLVLKHHGETVCDVPLAPLFDDAPLYDGLGSACIAARLSPAPAPRTGRCGDQGGLLPRWRPSWIWEQYDRHIMADTTTSATATTPKVVRVHGRKGWP